MTETLTTTNGGSHVKDALNRIEQGQGDQGAVLDELAARVTTLEGAAEKRGGGCASARPNVALRLSREPSGRASHPRSR